MISFFADILHNQGHILNCQASLRRNQQRLQDRMYGFEGWMAHMESHIHDAFHRPADGGNNANDPNEGNVH